MNCLEYFRQHFPNATLDDDAGAGDGCSNADVLAEMPLDSPCGLDCKQAIDAAVQLGNAIAKAYGPEGSMHPTGQYIFPNVLEAAVECCVCYIRG
jgi:hypothetical protein